MEIGARNRIAVAPDGPFSSCLSPVCVLSVGHLQAVSCCLLVASHRSLRPVRQFFVFVGSSVVVLEQILIWSFCGVGFFVAESCISGRN